MLTTRPTQVHQPFSIQLYGYDTGVATAEQDPATVAQYGLNYPGTSWQAATRRNKLRGVGEMVSGTLTDDPFMTLTFEYDEYDRVPPHTLVLPVLEVSSQVSHSLLDFAQLLSELPVLNHQTMKFLFVAVEHKLRPAPHIASLIGAYALGTEPLLCLLVHL